MKKRYIALMLLVTIAFTGCTKGGTATVKPAEPATEATATEVASTEVAEATEETVSAAETKEVEGPTEAASEEEANSLWNWVLPSGSARSKPRSSIRISK